MKKPQKIKIGLSCFFLIIIYFTLINLIFFAPMPYSKTEGGFSLSATEEQVIFEKWARKLTVEIELNSGGPIKLIHTVISDDVTDEITEKGKFQSQFQTWRITLSTWGTNATSAIGTYTIIDHTSPLLPKPKNNYVSTLEIYLLFMFSALLLFLGLSLFIIIVIGLFYIYNKDKNLKY